MRAALEGLELAGPEAEEPEDAPMNGHFPDRARIFYRPPKPACQRHAPQVGHQNLKQGDRGTMETIAYLSGALKIIRFRAARAIANGHTKLGNRLNEIAAELSEMIESGGDGQTNGQDSGG